MAVVRNLMVRAGADFSGLYQGMQRAQNETKRFSDKMGSALDGLKSKIAMLATTVIGIGGLKDATQDAIELEATTQNLNHILGQSADSYIQWSKTVATSYGFSQLEAEKYGASFAHMISLFANGSQDITKKTEDLMKTSAIIANGTGRSIDDVMQRIQSGMLGNVQAINDLGVYANQSMLEMSAGFKAVANGRHWDQLTMAERQQIIYMSIMEQAAKQYGDTLQNNVHNKLVTFTATLKNVKVAIGNAFLPILNVALPVLTALAQKLLWVVNIVSAFMSALFGVKPAHTAATQAANSHAGAVNTQANAMNNLGNAATKAADKVSKAQDKMKKSALGVAGFDEVNSLADKSDTSSSGSSGDSGAGKSGGDGGGIDTSSISPNLLSGIGTSTTEVSKKVQEMANKVRAAFGKMTDFIVTHKDIILAALAGLAAGFAAFWIASKWESISAAVVKAVEWIGVALAAVDIVVVIIAAAVAALVGAFVYFYRTNASFRGVVDGVWNAIKDAVVSLWKDVLVPLGIFLAGVFVDAWDALIVTCEWLWKDVLVPFGRFLGIAFVETWNVVKTSVEWLWKNILVPLGDYIGGAFVAIWGALKTVAEDVWKNVFIPLGDYLKVFWNTVVVPLGGVLKDVLATGFDAVKTIAKSLWNDVMIPLGNFLKDTFHPTVQALSDVFSALWKKILSPLGDFLGKAFLTAWQGIETIVKDLWDNVLSPLGDFLGKAFLIAWQGIVTVIKALWNDVLKPFIPYLTGTVITTFKTVGSVISDVSKAVQGVMTFISGIATGDWKKAWQGLSDVVSGIFGALKDIIKAPLNFIIDGVNRVIDGLNSISIKVPSWVPGFGGQTWGVSIPHIPKLAKGGIVTSPTIAQIGEAGPEMVVPLENTSFVDKLAGAVGTAVLQAMHVTNTSNAQNSKGNTILQIDGKSIARVINPYLLKENDRVGGTMITAK